MTEIELEQEYQAWLKLPKAEQDKVWLKMYQELSPEDQAMIYARILELAGQNDE